MQTSSQRSRSFSRSAADGIVVHRPRSLHPRDVTKRLSIPATAATRTVWDIASTQPPQQARHGLRRHAVGQERGAQQEHRGGCCEEGRSGQKRGDEPQGEERHDHGRRHRRRGDPAARRRCNRFGDGRAAGRHQREHHLAVAAQRDDDVQRRARATSPPSQRRDDSRSRPRMPLSSARPRSSCS